LEACQGRLLGTETKLINAFMFQKTKSLLNTFLYNREIQLLFLLLIFFLFDAFNVFFFKSGLIHADLAFKYLKLSSLPKSFVFAFVLLSLYKVSSRLSIALVFGVLIALLGFYFFENRFDGLFVWLILLSKYCFPVLLYVYFKACSNKNLDRVKSIYILIIILQIASVLLGYLYEIESFRSYEFGSRFGYSGLIMSVNELSLFYVSAGVFLCYLFEVEQKYKYLYLLVGIILVSFFSGTKACLLASLYPIIFLCVFIFKKLGVKIGLILMLLIFVLISMFLWKSGFVKFHIGLLESKGFLSMLTSTRSNLVGDRLSHFFSNYGFLSFLLGGGNPLRFLVEMDILDLFVLFGFVGVAVYFLLMFRTVFHPLSNRHLFFLFIQWFVIGMLAGHVFTSGVNAIYLAFTALYVNQRKC